MYALHSYIPMRNPTYQCPKSENIEFIEDLHAEWASNEAQVCHVYSEIEGSGKTEFAIEYAHRYAHEFDEITYCIGYIINIQVWLTGIWHGDDIESSMGNSSHYFYYSEEAPVKLGGRGQKMLVVVNYVEEGFSAADFHENIKFLLIGKKKRLINGEREVLFTRKLPELTIA